MASPPCLQSWTTQRRLRETHSLLLQFEAGYPVAPPWAWNPWRYRGCRGRGFDRPTGREGDGGRGRGNSEGHPRLREVVPNKEEKNVFF
eukprot:CAMPEP_0113301240 /NCGR_PEP_ID=MMETSP0010_2-20120614/2550_1 /TAXON_ID=216773 ORGANISM="Corethron hystrix, Strain 308" /NCGR_SAMPLE_ID=MMETSP0010_2 /ASSEMBLY_ACC=CAM_ASM_000155 /LENGTH=88 /DNA_ID=CAMNT_0000154827 /DNA_START=252 /DNA_END=518 /DNA_ORIENTATION=- /assembly_acc=CAM_ASM_000155